MLQLYDDWIIVTRPVGDTTARGTVTHSHLREDYARQLARELNAQLPTHNVWAMPREAY